MDPRGHEVALSHVIRLKDVDLAPGTPVAGSAWVIGDCQATTAANARLWVDFRRGGPEGEVLDQASSAVLEPPPSVWTQLTTPSQRIPAGADTMVFVFNAGVGLGHASVEVWADDLSLAVCSGQGEVLASWQSNALAEAERAEPAVATGPLSLVVPAEAYRNRIATTDRGTCFVDVDGRLQCWGLAPDTKVPLEKRFAEVDGLAALTKDGTVLAWSTDGKLEDTGKKGITDMGGGCFVHGGKEVWCTVNVMTDSYYRKVFEAEGIIDISGGLVLKADHTLVSLNLTPFGGHALPQGNQWVRAVSGCQLRADGSHTCERPSSPPAYGTVPTRLEWLYSPPSAGTQCGRLPGGRSLCWGDYGSIAFPKEPLSQVAFATAHACGITARDERVICWGLDSSAARPPAEIGSYDGSLSFPIGDPELATSKGPAPIASPRLASGPSCRDVRLDDLTQLDQGRVKVVMSEIVTRLKQHPSSVIQLASADPSRPKLRRCPNWLELHSITVSRDATRPVRMDVRVRFARGPVLEQELAELMRSKPALATRRYGGLAVAGAYEGPVDLNKVGAHPSKSANAMAYLWRERPMRSVKTGRGKFEHYGISMMIDGETALDLESTGANLLDTLPADASAFANWTQAGFSRLPGYATVSPPALRAPAAPPRAPAAARDPVVVCAPNGKRFTRLEDVDWPNWDGFLKGRPVECAACQQPGECCPSTEYAGARYGDLDGDGRNEGLISFEEPGALGGFDMEHAKVVALRDGCVAYLEWPEITPAGSEDGAVERSFQSGALRVVYYYSENPRSWHAMPNKVVHRYFRVVGGRLKEDVQRQQSLTPEQAGVYQVPTTDLLALDELRAAGEPKSERLDAKKAPAAIKAALPKLEAAMKQHVPDWQLKTAAISVDGAARIEGREVLLLASTPRLAAITYYIAWDLARHKLLYVKSTADKYFQLIGDNDPTLRSAVLHYARREMAHAL